tara:strand:+ start:116 stop:397 length:282 start_codon:yes stop_codon:yes gene_type:complete
MEDMKESAQSKFLDIASRIYSLSGLPWHLKSTEMKNKESLKKVRVQLSELKEMLDDQMDKLEPDLPEGFKQLLVLIDEEVLDLTDADIDDWIF